MQVFKKRLERLELAVLGNPRDPDEIRWVAGVGVYATKNGRPWHGKVKIPKGSLFTVIGSDGRHTTSLSGAEIKLSIP
jgi:hypothetical protein